MPVELRVAEIFIPINALFPIPVKIIFPVDLDNVSTILIKLSSITFDRFLIDSDSKAKVSNAIFFISDELAKMIFCLLHYVRMKNRVQKNSICSIPKSSKVGIISNQNNFTFSTPNHFKRNRIF